MTETPENSNDLQEPIAAEEAVAEVVESSPEPAPEPEPEPEPVQKKSSAPTQKRRPSAKGQTVSGLEVDDVRVDACVFKNTFARKSLSVYHVQRRLAELGYRDAHTDKTGWYGDLTMKAVHEYQADNGLPADGVITIDTLRSLFNDDPNVRVID